MIDYASINFYVAEVIAPVAPTYKRDENDLNHLFTIDVLVRYKNNEKIFEKVKPANNNIKQIPIIGENVLVFQGFSHDSHRNKRDPQWYYTLPLGVQSGTNTNYLPINSVSFTPDPDAVERIVSPLQPYLGDLLTEGRWGNSIRLGSTISTKMLAPDLIKKYDVSPSWYGPIIGAPIIILSNSKESKKGKQYSVENIEADYSSLYLTSEQQIKTILLGDRNSRNPLTKFLPAETEYKNSQLIGSADRIILKAKTDVVVLDSPIGIVLNTTGEVKIGNDAADQSMVHGDVLVSILQKIINQLLSGVQVGDTYAPVGGYANGGKFAKDAQELLQELLSSTYFIKKNTY
jgi:hypothetical protein